MSDRLTLALAFEDAGIERAKAARIATVIVKTPARRRRTPAVAKAGAKTAASKRPARRP